MTAPERGTSERREARVFVCVPSRGEVAVGIVDAMLAAQHTLLRAGHRLILFTPCSSVFTDGFNWGWVTALNLRAEGEVTHFLLLHADVVPLDRDWITRLLAEMARVEADVLSVILPIKSAKGLSSTARDTDPWRPVRYTMTEVLARPETWTAPDLLFNTGLLFVDFRQPWVEQVCFEVRNTIGRGPGGEWVTHFEPEDWHFSRQCRALGLRCFATRIVRAEHLGTHAYPNFLAWGQAQDYDNLATARGLAPAGAPRSRRAAPRGSDRAEPPRQDGEG